MVVVVVVVVWWWWRRKEREERGLTQPLSVRCYSKRFFSGFCSAVIRPDTERLDTARPEGEQRKTRERENKPQA